jgi:predicted ArsR family transcriptional regulator
LAKHPAFEPPNAPVSIDDVASALGVSPSTVKTHLRRIRRADPARYEALLAARRRAFERYHAAVDAERRER